MGAERATGGETRRERKRREREARVLAAARQLFRTKGFDETTMAAIAEAADVAVGTVYNYFPSKDLLLVAMLKADLLAGFPALLAEPEPFVGEDPVGYLLAPPLAFLSLLDGFDKTLWYQFMAAIYGARWPMDAPVFELDWLMMAQTARRVEVLQAAGWVRPEVDPEQATLMIFALTMMRFQMYVMDPDATVDSTADGLRQDGALAFAGLGAARWTGGQS